jgi:transposase-like protein
MDHAGLGTLRSDDGREDPGVTTTPMTADPEVEPKATRRRFTAAYKLAVLEEMERNPGKAGAIMRREGLYSSNVTSWRKQRRGGTLKALDKKRGRTGKSAADLEVEKLRRENARLQSELEKAQIIIGAQKKLAEILGIDLPKIMAKNEEKE